MVINYALSWFLFAINLECRCKMYVYLVNESVIRKVRRIWIECKSFVIEFIWNVACGHQRCNINYLLTRKMKQRERTRYIGSFSKQVCIRRPPKIVIRYWPNIYCWNKKIPKWFVDLETAPERLIITLHDNFINLKFKIRIRLEGNCNVLNAPCQRWCF